jgi:hypothetical protein
MRGCFQAPCVAGASRSRPSRPRSAKEVFKGRSSWRLLHLCSIPATVLDTG